MQAAVQTDLLDGSAQPGPAWGLGGERGDPGAPMGTVPMRTALCNLVCLCHLQQLQEALALRPETTAAFSEKMQTRAPPPSGSCAPRMRRALDLHSMLA